MISSLHDFSPSFLSPLQFITASGPIQMLRGLVVPFVHFVLTVFGGSLIARKTKKHTTVSYSSTEAELQAMTVLTA